MMEKKKLTPIKLNENAADIIDVLGGTLSDDSYPEISCTGVGGAACKDGCLSGCKDSSKSGGDCSQSCQKGCSEGCKEACKGGNK